MKLIFLMSLMLIAANSWAKQDCENHEKDDYSISTELIQKGNHLIHERIFYIKAGCNLKDGRVRDQVVATILQMDKVSVYAIDSVNKEFLDPTWVMYANDDQDCGFKDWKLNEQKDVSGLDCSVTSWEAGETKTFEN